MTKEETRDTSEKVASPEGEMARPPSVMWLVIPLLLIMVYAALR